MAGTLAILASIAACDASREADASSPSDASTLDASAFDAGALDAGTLDAGTVDAGTMDSPWRSGPALPVRLQEISAVTIDDRIWVVGGFEPGGEVSTVRVLDPREGTWSLGPPLPVARHHVQLATLEGDLYVLGGMETIRFTNVDEAWVLRRGASAWAPIAPLPEDRGAGVACAIEGRIYLAGGQGRGGLSPRTLVYDPASDLGSVAAAIPTPREHLAGFAYGGELWAIGGRALSLATAMDVVEIYDPRTDTWREGPRLGHTHGGFAAAVLEDDVAGDLAIAVGGEQPDRALDVVEVLALPDGRWETIEPVPTPRHGHAMAAAAGRAWVIGGADAPIFAAVDAVESWAPRR
jgi:non-specific serine/threonine protein kinase